MRPSIVSIEHFHHFVTPEESNSRAVLFCTHFPVRSREMRRDLGQIHAVKAGTWRLLFVKVGMQVVLDILPR